MDEPATTWDEVVDAYARHLSLERDLTPHTVRGYVTDVRGLGAVTPFGGTAFLAGWAVLAWAVLRDRRN